MNRNFFRTFLWKFHTFFVHLVLGILFFFHNSQDNFFAPVLIGYFIHFCHVLLFETNYFFSIQQIHPLLHIFPLFGRNFQAHDSFSRKKRNDTQKMSFLAAHCSNAVYPPQPYIILYSFQISRLYSAIVLSDEKKPAFAVLMSIFFAHAMRSS